MSGERGSEEKSETVLEARRVDADVAADDLQHDAWELARPVYINRYWSGREAPAGRHAEARVLWSDAALLVRFTCRQEEPLVLSPRPRTESKTVGLWDYDVCEVFVAPDEAEPGRYFEFEAAPTGEWLDLIVRWTEGVRETDWEYRSGMTAAGRVLPGFVTVCMRLPWEAFGRRPGPGELWRANLFRCVGRDPDRGYLAWRPTFTDEPCFHVPEAFGGMEFVKK